MREFLERENMVAVNTMHPGASGKTWYGGRKAATRVDYVLVDTTRIHPDDHAVLGRELHRRLRTLVSLEVMDHVPVAWNFTYAAWDVVKSKAPSYDYESMVRSCVTWDDKATTFATTVAGFFHTEWARRRDETGTPATPLSRMADMVWSLEETLNQTAQEIWPRRPQGYIFSLSDDDRAWLKWQSVLRRHAWSTLLQVRDASIAKNLSSGPRCRLLRVNRTGRGMRMGGGELWDSMDCMECIFTTWLRYARWHGHEDGIRSFLQKRTKAWEANMARAVEHARRQNDTRRMWALMRQLGGTGRRERKKCTKDVVREDPTPEEWELAMAKPGKDGGCLAAPVARISEDTKYDRKTLISVSLPAGASAPPPRGSLHGRRATHASPGYEIQAVCAGWACAERALPNANGMVSHGCTVVRRALQSRLQDLPHAGYMGVSPVGSVGKT